MVDELKQIKKDMERDSETQKADVQEGLTPNDNDNQESVAEYVEKKKREREEENVNDGKEKKSGSEKDKETLKTVANVISSVPHYAAFSLGAATGGGLAKLLGEMGNK